MPNLVKFREDPDAMLVMSLEEYDEVTGVATKAAILKKDVVGKTPPVTQVASAEEGLLVALNERGTVDLPHIAALYRKPEEQVVAELGDLIFLDPESKTWQTADAYLSGSVRAKLAAADRAGPAYTRNAETLRCMQPEDVLPGDIDANLGAPWIPESDIQAFAAILFRVAPSAVRIGHLKKDAIWSGEADYAAERSVAATSDYGTPRAGGAWLFELALNMKSPVICDTTQHGDREERVVNPEATLAAREKQKLIKERFRAWVFADPERTERLVRLYNDTYNNLRPRLFDGSHLDFPGMNRTVQLRPHQTDAVWRGMSAGNTLLAHAVGAGKTFTMAATGMKIKQAGLIKKPMYVVPNHLLEQFSREFLQLYPNARLLVAAKEDFTRERRRMRTARIASGEWDGIVVTHSSFERIGMSRDYQERFLREQIAEYDQLLRDGAGRDATRAHRNLIKTIEKQKAQRQERLKDLLAEEKKDDGLVFDELGVDHVFIDEAHYFKNLETPTKLDRVAGIQTGGSERAFDL
jgi:N12 class adenine-specific DNA methylase